MKKLLSSLLLLSLACLVLSCHSTKTTMSVSGRSETVAQSADRLSSSLMTDSTSRWLTISADSMIILFVSPAAYQNGNGQLPVASQESTSSRDAGAAALDDMYFHGYKPPATKDGNSSPTGDKQLTALWPDGVKIYGLHIDAGGNEKSSVQASSENCETKATQSVKSEEEAEQKSAPSKTPKYIFYTLVLACAVYGIYRFRHKFK